MGGSLGSYWKVTLCVSIASIHFIKGFAIQHSVHLVGPYADGNGPMSVHYRWSCRPMHYANWVDGYAFLVGMAEAYNAQREAAVPISN